MEDRLDINQELNLAVKNHIEGRLEGAEIIYRKILNEDSENHNALHLLGLINHQKGKHKEAIELISRAIQLKPDIAVYYGNLAMVYDSLHKEDESARNFKKALEINPQYLGAHLAHYNLGIFYKDKGDIMKSLEHYNKAIEIKEDFADAHWNRGLILLLLGRFEQGWKDYEYRFKKQNSTDSRNFNKPKWQGSELFGKKILLVAEQGFGDNIQFIRYAPLVKGKGAYVILECKKELKRLFENFPGIDEIVEKNNAVPAIDFDYYIHLMSLPGIFNTDLNNIPNKGGYIKPNNQLVTKFKEKCYSNFKIGIVWAGNPSQGEDINRSMNFERFKILKQIPNVSLFSLQKGEASKQLNDSDIIDMNESIKDFADTASIIENLDLIISTDTSVAHLAGAMGKQVWVLLKPLPDWRWLLDRKDSPWYRSMRLFRQKKLGDWDFVFEEVISELKTLLSIAHI